MFGGCDCCTCGIGRCCGATFSVHWTFWFNMVVQLIFALIQYASSWKYILLIATVWGPACLLALVFHEWGHIGATRCQRGSYSYSMLWPLGGFNDCTVPNGKCMQEFFIALCGPLMHLPMLFLWLIILSISADEGVSYYGSAGFDINRLNDEGAGEWFSQLAKRSLDVNIMIFCLNLLLPAYPMDAAIMVAAVCGHFGLSIQSTGWVLLVIGTLLGALGLVMGIIFLIAGTGPGVFLLLLGLYILYTSWQLYGQIQAGTLSQHPIFKPDCYHKRTNLSHATTPPARQTPPASPRRMNNKASAPPASPRRINNKDSAAPPQPQPKRSGSKKPLPKREGAKSQQPKGEGSKSQLPRRESSKIPSSGDIETGNDAASPKKAPAKKKAPPKKKTSGV